MSNVTSTSLNAPGGKRASLASRVGMQLKRNWRLYVMLLLPMAFYLIFCYKPMYGVIIAFQKYNIRKGIWGSKFIGWDNFEFMLKLRDFPIALLQHAVAELYAADSGLPDSGHPGDHAQRDPQREGQEALSNHAVSAALPVLGYHRRHGAANLRAGDGRGERDAAQVGLD